MNIAELARLNPWWRDPSRIGEDPHIVEFDKAGIQWKPRIMARFDLDEDLIYTLRGPRQVGKTTLMKLMIRNLLDEGVDPNSILYLTCDAIHSGEDLQESLEIFLDYSNRYTQDRKRLFIDEISSLKDWERRIKFLVDAGRLRDTTVILTGSHSLDIKHSMERLPGRRGSSAEPLNKVLLPLKFSEYVETVSPRLKEEMGEFLKAPRDKKLEYLGELARGNIEIDLVDRGQIFKDDLKALFNNYLITGGVMRAIREFYSKDSISRSTYEIYISSLLGDLARWNFKEDYVRRVLRSVVRKMTTRISLNSIAKANDIGSHNTVSNYLEALEDSYVLNQFFKVDPNTKMAEYAKERKVYPIDPFIFHAIRGWVSGNVDYQSYAKEIFLDPQLLGNLIEMVIGDHLLRCAFDLNPSDVFAHHEHVFYWKKKKSDREIDFVMKHDNDLLPVEVKYQNKVSNRDLDNLFSLRRGGILISKDAIGSYKEYSILPPEIFLLCI